VFSRFYSLIQNFIDSFGVITQKDGDGGDSLQREGMFAFSEYMHYHLGKIDQNQLQSSTDRYTKILKTLEVSWGNFRRHPDTSKWYGQSDRMSRDQLTSNIVAMGVVNQKMLLKTLIGHLLKRCLLFTTNTRGNFVMPGDSGYRWKLPDITGPSIWGAYLRGFYKYLYPIYPIVYGLLTILDLENVINSYIILYKVKKDPTFSDHLSHQMLLNQAYLIYKTPTIMWAHKVYAWCNPERALDQYFDPSTGAEPMNDIYRDINSYFFK
jgi:hypothetical protein